MLNRLQFYWRVVATGLCFVSFGIGGLLLGVLVFPLIHMMIRQRQSRMRCARTVLRVTFRAFIGMMHALGVLRYEIIGLEKLERQGLLILANHPTLIDTVFLMAFVKRADCIVKAGLWNNPFMRGPVRAAGYINNDQGQQLVADCIGSLQDGNNLIVFPEGTRTAKDAVICMKRGAANIAVRGARNITPVLITCAPVTLGKGEKWWQIPPHRAQFRIEVLEDIEIAGFIAGAASEVMAARHLSDYLQKFFTQEYQRHA
ncbi:lysophospholipid acyltransferase family protein [Undibacterium sp. Ren11W]|uniref:lysophospholipid acyltransferase family protein n=1 Tax=Undibacterium sp. Ren11W TaxID=3413045 RepID=UPI003BF34992